MSSSHLPKIEKEKNGRVVCTLTFTTEQVTPAREKALTTLGANVKMPGFRPGKAPRETLLQKIDPAHLLEQTVRELLPDTVETLVKEHALKPIIAPKIAVVSEEPLTVRVVFVEHPHVKLKGVEKIKIEKKPSSVEDKEVERVIASLLERHATAAEVDRPSKLQDQVTVDFWGADKEGKEVAGTRMAGHTVVLGSGKLIPGFEDALVGLRKNEQKTFTVTFPEKYHAPALQGQPVTFQATMQKVEEMTRPELTDDFVKQHLHAPSAAEFRTIVRSQMSTQEERVELQRREGALLDAIRAATNVDLATELIDEEVQTILSDLSEDLQRRGQTIEDWLKQSKKKPEEIEKELKKQAEERLKLRLGVRELMTTKDIQVSEEEMEKAVAELLSRLEEKERRDVAPLYTKGAQNYEQLLWQKKVEKLFEMMLAA